MKPLAFVRRGPSGIELCIVERDGSDDPKLATAQLTPERALSIAIDMSTFALLQLERGKP